VKPFSQKVRRVLFKGRRAQRQQMNDKSSNNAHYEGERRTAWGALV
jgi:hypothetical protein